MRVVLVGDIHREFLPMIDFLSMAKSNFGVHAAIQVGDFGFFENDFFSDLYFPIPVYAIDGNHEDHEWLHRCVQDGTVQKWQDAHNLIYQPRGSVVRMGSSNIGFIGGALHVDREQESNLGSGITNYIQRPQSEMALRNFKMHNLDLIVSHSCPSGIGIGMKSNALFASTVAQFLEKSGFTASPQNDCGEAELKFLWDSLNQRENQTPPHWVFGHFHVFHKAVIAQTQFICVPKLGVLFPMVIWDTEEKTMLVINV